MENDREVITFEEFQKMSEAEQRKYAANHGAALLAVDDVPNKAEKNLFTILRRKLHDWHNRG